MLFNLIGSKINKTLFSKYKLKYCIMANDKKEIKTCGLIIIGDEILKAQVKDTNSHFICKKLRDYGIKISRISVIPDDINVISKEIRKFSNKNNYVITTGGIGPTHDDITYESLAKAFDQPLKINFNLLKFWNQFYPVENLEHPQPNEAAYKFSNCPEHANIIFTEPLNSFSKYFPVLNVENVFVFPGTPSIVEKCFPLLLGTHIITDVTFHTYSLYLSVDEVLILDNLNDCVNRHYSVIFGSYPLSKKTKITLEAMKENELNDAKMCLMKNMSSYIDVYDTIMNNESLIFAQHSIKLIEECFNTYTVDDIFISFNGGKDCTVLLHLVMSLLKSKGLIDNNRKLLAVYFKIENSFPEVEKFVQDSVDKYNLELIEMSGSMKEGLKNLLEERPNLKAVFMGSRRGDPRCQSLTELSKTDSDWPEIIRINPLLDWSYQDIWKIIREFSVPYCSLYDQGYSSLGSSTNTTKNPLLVKEENGIIKYLPADSLNEDTFERHGRH